MLLISEQKLLSGSKKIFRNNLANFVLVYIYSSSMLYTGFFPCKYDFGTCLQN